MSVAWVECRGWWGEGGSEVGWVIEVEGGGAGGWWERSGVDGGAKRRKRLLKN